MNVLTAWRRAREWLLAIGLGSVLVACSWGPSAAVDSELERPQVRTRLGDSQDSCAELPVFVEGLLGARVRVDPGDSREIRVPASTFRWSCGTPAQQKVAPESTNLIVVTRLGNGEQVSWIFYREGGQ